MMSLNGIDIASYQAGIDLSIVPCDFVIVKATQGTSYVNPDFNRAINQADQCGKLMGIYHYIGGHGAKAEMDHFCRHFKPWLGKAIPVLDWESIQNNAWRDESYLETCIREFIAMTGVPPIIYASLSVFPWALCSKYNCGTWVAQYANMNDTGYQNNPWNEGAYSCAIRQYSSSGKLNGWSGRLDINKAYMDAEAWHKYANPDGDVAIDPTPAQKSIEQLADEVLADVWGVDPERRQKLLAAGYDADAVQKRVNEKVAVQNFVPAGKYRIVVNGLRIRRTPNGQIVPNVSYNNGDTVILDGTSAVANNIIWGRYIGASSGQYRWIGIRSIDGSDVYARKM